MNRKTKILPFVAAVFLTLPAISWADHLGGDIAHPGYPTIRTEDVRNTLHNLGDTISGPGGVGSFNNPNIVSTGREVCVFCHTPHGANTSAPGAAPLWNRAIPTSVYTLYSSPNFDGTPSQPQGVSLACLSCHDGTIALDALVNLPLSGGFETLTPASSDLVNPEGVATLITAAGIMDPGTRTDLGAPNYTALTGGASPFPNLGVNLTDDHPISFAMGSTDPQFDDITATDNINLTDIRNGTTSGYATDKRDRIRLYGANGSDTNAGDKTDWVECASCHNPHAPRPLFLRLPSADGLSGLTNQTVIPASWGGNGTVTWGQDPNRGSAICLSCHTK